MKLLCGKITQTPAEQVGQSGEGAQVEAGGASAMTQLVAQQLFESIACWLDFYYSPLGRDLASGYIAKITFPL